MPVELGLLVLRVGSVATAAGNRLIHSRNSRAHRWHLPTPAASVTLRLALAATLRIITANDRER
jgi:hypothetical protein